MLGILGGLSSWNFFGDVRDGNGMNFEGD